MSEAKKPLTNEELEDSALRVLKAIVDIPVTNLTDLDAQIEAAGILLGYVRCHHDLEGRASALEKRNEFLFLKDPEPISRAGYKKADRAYRSG